MLPDAWPPGSAIQPTKRRNGQALVLLSWHPRVPGSSCLLTPKADSAASNVNVPKQWRRVRSLEIRWQPQGTPTQRAAWCGENKQRSVFAVHAWKNQQPLTDASGASSFPVCLPKRTRKSPVFLLCCLTLQSRPGLQAVLALSNTARMRSTAKVTHGRKTESSVTL